MAKYDIWVEGYAVQEGSGTAQCVAHGIEGYSLKEAVMSWYSSIPNAKDLYGELRIDNRGISLWGCRVFDNEVDARKSFG